MLKRLIEVALPLKEVSEQSAREKSIRHGHISTLHIWWARRPLAACRAVVFASLIPDPDDPECPEGFRNLVMDILGKNQFRPTNDDGSFVKDTPRNRCLEFIKHLVRWENSNNPEYIEPAQRLIAAAHKFLHPDAEGDAPKVLDPFAGGGAIPLEVLRLGCESNAIDLNPVAYLIELCTLVYPQKYGQPDSRPVPDYIKRLIAHNRVKRLAQGEPDLFANSDSAMGTNDGIIPQIDISEPDYRKNSLAADIRYWGYWILEAVRKEISQFYPTDNDGGVPIAYLWAWTATCPNPACKGTIPLIRQLWLCNKPDRKVSLQIVPDVHRKRCVFEIIEGSRLDFDPSDSIMRKGNAECPFCQQIATAAYLREECKNRRMNQQMTAVITIVSKQQGKQYRTATDADLEAFQKAARSLETARASSGKLLLPTEKISLYAPRRVSPPLYGIDTFTDLFNDRQLLALITFSRLVQKAHMEILRWHGTDYGNAVGTYLGLCVSRFADFNSKLCVLNNVGGRGVVHTFGRQAIPFVWDYAESAPFNEQGANWQACVDAAVGTVEKILTGRSGRVRRASATHLPLIDSSMDAVITDPPYYDSVPYSALSDFFYVWLKTVLRDTYPAEFGTPLTPKSDEIVEQRPHRLLRKRKDSAFYEKMMAATFVEMRRVLHPSGVSGVMFAHKTTTAWEALITGLLRSGMIVTASWPFHTERPGRMTARGTASLASSVTLVCRRRGPSAGGGFWDDVREELKTVAHERLDFFWNQGIRGADFFISAIGPALSVFGKYERVTKLSGEEVTVGQFLDEVRSFVTNYALAKILKTTHTAAIDPESRFYVVWKWSYGDAKVPADESFKLSQALGMQTEEMWDRTGVLEKSGENVQSVPISKRMRVRDLGAPTANGTPASLIDVLHRLCAFREKGDTQGMAQFLGQSGQANNPTLWLVAQAISEILPDGDREKQLMQGLLNQREGLAEATQQSALF